jgi:hypothetical protein
MDGLCWLAIGERINKLCATRDVKLRVRVSQMQRDCLDRYE